MYTPRFAVAESALPALSRVFTDLVSDFEAKVSSSASVHVYVSVADSGALVFSRGSEDLLKVGSLQRILVANRALRHLGPEYRYPLEVFVERLPQESDVRLDVSAGLSLNRETVSSPGDVGSIMLRFYGDPTFSDVDLSSLAERLRDLGVTRIKDVIIDRTSFFDPQPIRGTALSEAWHDAVVLNSNAYSVFVFPRMSMKDAFVKLSPGMNLGSDSGVSVRRTPGENIDISLVPNESSFFKVSIGPATSIEKDFLVKVVGKIGQFDSPYVQRFPHPLPPSYLYSSLKSYLTKFNIHVSGRGRLGPVSQGAKELLVHESFPLSDWLKRVYDAEDGEFFIEQLAYALGQRKDGTLSRDEALRNIEQNLKSVHKASDVTLLDASGVHPDNRLNLEVLGKSLEKIYQDIGISPYFLANLPKYPVGTGEDALQVESSIKSDRQERELDSLWVLRADQEGLRGIAGYLPTFVNADVVIAYVISGQFKKTDAVNFEHAMIKALLGIRN